MATFLSQFKIPILSTGGIGELSQVEVLLDCGVQLIGMATALVQNPYVVPMMNAQLAQRY